MTDEITPATRLAKLEETVERHSLYIAGHEGKINAYWEAQHTWNAGVDKNFTDIFKRLTALEKRIAWVAGLSAGIGAALGAGAGILFNS